MAGDLCKWQLMWLWCQLPCLDNREVGRKVNEDVAVASPSIESYFLWGRGCKVVLVLCYLYSYGGNKVVDGSTDQHSKPLSSSVPGRRAPVGLLGWKELHHLLGSICWITIGQKPHTMFVAMVLWGDNEVFFLHSCALGQCCNGDSGTDSRHWPWRRTLTEDQKARWLTWNYELRVLKGPLILDALLFRWSHVTHFGKTHTGVRSLKLPLKWKLVLVFALLCTKITGRVPRYLRGECFKPEKHF